MDADNTGTIEIDELRMAYQSLNVMKKCIDERGPWTEEERLLEREEWHVLSDEKIDEILNKVDQDGNGRIAYSEFLTHSLTEQHLSKENLFGFFRILLHVDKRVQTDSEIQAKVAPHLVPMADIRLHMPIVVSEYTDFYAGKNHAVNVGTMFRGPENALPPNWLRIPLGYNGRASSVGVSGTDVRRPRGGCP